MNFDQWCTEFIRLLGERTDGFPPDEAIRLAQSKQEDFDGGLTPEESLEAELECWDDDGDEPDPDLI